ncbi:hypothetical protein A4A49_01258 [Nicotiana attenuata]|uniref:Uncharacterized protein n=1 Tax=Nicotiana attenuata TaxID=49451 RepID=A0A1J6IIJ5_NICAT|nr:hypothetical protein A4A49_01258 [Nicotiana attenuata]
MLLPRMLRWHSKKVTSDPDWNPFKQRVDDPGVAPGAVSLVTYGEVDIYVDDPLGWSIPGSPLVDGFSNIGKGGPCRMCNAQPSNTDVHEDLKVVNEKLDKVLKILGELQNQNASPSKLVESPWYMVTRLQSRLRNDPIDTSKMRKLKQMKKKKPKELLALMHVRNIKRPHLYARSHVIMDIALCNNMCTAWNKVKEATSKEGNDLDFCETIDACQDLRLTPLMLYPQGSMPQPGAMEWCKAIVLYCVWQIDNKYFVPVVFHLAMVFEFTIAIESNGAYAVKVIDFLLTDTSLDQLNDKRIELFKEKFAVDIFRGRMDSS